MKETENGGTRNKESSDGYEKETKGKKKKEMKKGTEWKKRIMKDVK